MTQIIADTARAQRSALVVVEAYQNFRFYVESIQNGNKSVASSRRS